MSQSLEALEALRKQSATHRWLEQQFEREWLNAIEKELKALAIIKEKRVDIRVLLLIDSLYKYNNFDSTKRIELTQEEYDLLEEVLK